MKAFCILCFLVVSCGGPQVPIALEQPEPPPEPPLLALNREARAQAITETLHGREVADPYRALEEDNELTRRWITAQTEHTTNFLAQYQDDAMAARLDSLLSIGTIGSVAVGGRRIFYTKREGEAEQPSLYLAEGTAIRALIDPTTYGERAALDWFYPSPRGRYVAFGISHNGDERSMLHVLDVNSGTVLPDRIPRTKWTNLAWLRDESAFYYTRYPNAGEPGYDAENEDTYFPRIFFHRLGTDTANDPLIFAGEANTDFPSVNVSDDDRWLAIHVFRGWSASDLYLFDRGANARDRRVGPDTEHLATRIAVGEDHIFVGQVHRNKLYVMTNEGAPRYRIATVSTDQAPDRTQWTDVLAQSEGTIDSFLVTRDKLVAHVLENVQSKVRAYDLNGRFFAEIEVPPNGSVGTLAGQSSEAVLAIQYSSYVTPPTLYSIDLSSRSSALTRIDQVRTNVDLSTLHVRQEFVQSSSDGALIPMTIVQRSVIEHNGNNPVLIYGYGGFNVSLLPEFTRSALYWLERGGIYAVVNLRGGGEFGEEWHRAGNLLNKENVFEDFEAAIRYFASAGISRAERIAITGGSNGGLLMGAMATRNPDIFRAAASYVGLYDMVRYHRFPPAELWVTEYGSADSAEQFEVLFRYSPYHRVHDGTPYPSMLIETADHDSRVFWGHSTKFAARLQDATTSNRPILFYMVSSVGHGAGTRRSDLVQRYVRMFSFLEAELGMRTPRTGATP